MLTMMDFVLTTMHRCILIDSNISAIAAVVDDVAKVKFQLGSVAIGPVLLAVLAAVRQDRVPLEPAFGNLVSAIVVLEGIGRQVRFQERDLDLLLKNLHFLIKNASFCNVMSNQLHPGLDLFALAMPMLAKQAVSRVIG